MERIALLDPITKEILAIIPLKPKTFKTGSRGFSICEKVYLNGKKYQFIGYLVEIGSKPKGGAK